MIKQEFKVIDHPHLVRKDGVIVNTDSSGYQSFIQARNKALTDQQRIESLENDLQELKTMFQLLLGKQNEQK